MHSSFKRCILTGLILLSLSACTHNAKMKTFTNKNSPAYTDRLMHGITLLKAGNYKEARRIFSEVLRYNPSDCQANFLNSFSYDLEGKANNNYADITIAQVGYNIAQKFCRYKDPWPFFYSGINNYYMSNYSEAVLDFGIASAIPFEGVSNQYILEWYATALFSSGHPDKANHVIDKYLAGKSTKFSPKESALLMKLYKNKQKKFSSSFRTYSKPNLQAGKTPTSNGSTSTTNGGNTTNASNQGSTSTTNGGNTTSASSQDSTSATNGGNTTNASNQGSTSTTNGGNTTSASSQDSTSATNGSNGTTTAANTDATAQTNTGTISTGRREQVLIDAVIIVSKRIDASNVGINLLDGLQLQFGSSVIPADGFSFVKNSYGAKFSNYNNQISATGSPTYPTVPLAKTITSIITIPAIMYDLNIFNSTYERSEILARPTLVALEGKTASYFSGSKLILGISGSAGSSGEIQTKAIGLTLKVTPTFLEDGVISLSVNVAREILSPLSATSASSVDFENVVTTLSEDVNTDINLHYGETAILSALTETDLTKNYKGANFLDKIPVLKYLFSNKQTSEAQTYVLILLTPRKYLSFASHGAYRDQNKVAYLYGTLVEPNSSIDHVLRNISRMSLYKKDVDKLANVLTLYNQETIKAVTLDSEYMMLKNKNFRAS